MAVNKTIAKIEEAKTSKLNLQLYQSMTQGAEDEAKLWRIKKLKSEKEAMKKLGKQEGMKRDQNKKPTAKTKRVKSDIDGVKKPEAKKTKGDQGMKEKQGLQGLREMPMVKDRHGCIHNGLRSLTLLDRPYLTMFVKNEKAWLHKKPCKDCGDNKNEETDDMRILEMGRLLENRGRKELGYYCNCGQTGHLMEEDDPRKASYSCDMVLCPGCYYKRLSRLEGDGKRRTRQTRN